VRSGLSYGVEYIKHLGCSAGKTITLRNGCAWRENASQSGIADVLRLRNVIFGHGQSLYDAA